MVYRSTKRYGHEQGLSCVFRQPEASSHCALLHGYALAVTLVFEADELDHRNWVIDFGGLKEIKQWLGNTFDHTMLIAESDPLLPLFMQLERADACRLLVLDAVGCEAFAQLVYHHVEAWLIVEGHSPRVTLVSAEVAEHGSNSAIYLRP